MHKHIYTTNQQADKSEGKAYRSSNHSSLQAVSIVLFLNNICDSGEEEIYRQSVLFIWLQSVSCRPFAGSSIILTLPPSVFVPLLIIH